MTSLPAFDLPIQEWVVAGLGASLGIGSPPPVPPDSLFSRRVVELSQTHWVAGFLARALENQPEYQGSELLHWLRLTIGLVQARSIGWVEQVGGILHQLHHKKIEAIVLKGWALIYRQYDGDPSSRPSTDLDVVVAPGQFKVARELFFEMGYTPFLAQPWNSFICKLRMGEMLSKPGAIPIGLHVSTLPIPGEREDRMIEDWFRRAQAVVVAGEPALTLCAEDNLVYLCAHLALHHQYHPALFRYFDMATLIHQAGKDFGWDQAYHQAAEWGLILPLQRCLEQLDSLWHGVVPPEQIATARQLSATPGERWLHHWSAEKEHTPLKSLVEAMISQRSLGAQAQLLLGTAIPSPEYMRWRYGQKPRGLGWTAYLERMFRAIK